MWSLLSFTIESRAGHEGCCYRNWFIKNFSDKEKNSSSTISYLNVSSHFLTPCRSFVAAGISLSVRKETRGQITQTQEKRSRLRDVAMQRGPAREMPPSENSSGNSFFFKRYF